MKTNLSIVILIVSLVGCSADQRALSSGITTGGGGHDGGGGSGGHDGGGGSAPDGGGGGAPDGGPYLASDGGLATLYVDIGNGARIEARLDDTGGDVTLLAAPATFSAPLHVTAVARAGHPVHDLSELAAACAVPLAAGETPTFSGDFLFDALEQKSLDAAIVNSGAGKIEQLTTAHVTNAPVITGAHSNEPSFAAPLAAALASSPHDAPFTSSNWALLCSSLSAPPGVTISLVGSFDGTTYKATTSLDALLLDVK